jgi:hypothetical protein
MTAFEVRFSFDRVPSVASMQEWTPKLGANCRSRVVQSTFGWKKTQSGSISSRPIRHSMPLVTLTGFNRLATCGMIGASGHRSLDAREETT